MTSETSLGDLIRRQRIARGWSQEDLAERIVNISGHAIKQSDISRIERGHVLLPRFERLVAISQALEIPIGELILAASLQESTRPDSQARLITPEDVLSKRDTNR